MNVQQQWFLPDMTLDWFYTSTNSAFTTNEIGLCWLREILIPQTATNLNEGQWRLLISDGHKSHVSSDFMQEAYLSNIWCYYLVPHTSHIFQPLDLALFSPLKRRFRAIRGANPLMDDFEVVRKQQFLNNYRIARNCTMKLTNCMAGFKAAGIWPFNPSKGLLSSFVPKEPENSSQPRPTTPPNATIDPNVVITPYNRQQLSQAFKTVSRNITVDRTVRSLFTKTGKVLDGHAFDNAAAQYEINLLKRKLNVYRNKHKRQRPVNPNLTFVGLQDIQLAAIGPVARVSAAQPPVKAIGMPTNPVEIASDPIVSIQRATTALLGIRYQ